MNLRRHWIVSAALLCCAVFLVGTTTLIRERRAILPGKWYPDNAQAISKEVDRFMEPAVNHQAPGRMVGAIVPSAPWSVSGPMSGEILKHVVPGAYDRVIVLTASHSAVFYGCSVAAVQFYRTPIGPVPMDMDALYLLRRNVLITPRSVSYDKSLLESGARKPVHETEYGIEVVLPMLQARLGTFRLMPFVVGEIDTYTGKPDRQRIEEVAAAIKRYVSPSTLVVCTTGMTRYGRQYGFTPFVNDVAANVKLLDEEALRFIVRRDVGGFLRYIEETGNPIDGAIPIAIMMRLMPDGAQGDVLHRFSTADVVENPKAAESFASVAFYDLTRPEPAPRAPSPSAAVPDAEVEEAPADP